MTSQETIQQDNSVNRTNVLINGLQGGIFLIASWLLFRILFTEANTMWQYLGYVILMYFVYNSITMHRAVINKGKRFQNGIKVGFQVSAIAALVVALINAVVAMASPELAVTKFNKEITDIFTIIAVDFGIILEIMVVGMLTTFIVLQSQKDSSSSRVND